MEDSPFASSFPPVSVKFIQEKKKTPLTHSHTQNRTNEGEGGPEREREIKELNHVIMWTCKVEVCRAGQEAGNSAEFLFYNLRAEFIPR